MSDSSILSHSLPFKCEHCHRSFKKRNKLARHINETHLNLKDFSCSVCGKKFKRNSHLKRHMITHSSDPKPFKCLYEDCLLRFSDKYHLERHIKHKNIKFECKACGLSFEKKLFLFKHNFQSHKMDKPFKCPHTLCNKSFYTTGTLAKHFKHHEFPFKKTKNALNQSGKNPIREENCNDIQNINGQIFDKIKEEEKMKEITVSNETPKREINDFDFEKNDELYVKVIHHIDQENMNSLEPKLEASPEKIFLDFEENFAMMKEHLFEHDLNLKDEKLKLDMNESSINKDTLFLQNGGIVNSQSFNPKEIKKEEHNNHEETTKEVVDPCKKNGECCNNFVYACMESNCGKTYSTVRIFSYLIESHRYSRCIT